MECVHEGDKETTKSKVSSQDANKLKYEGAGSL